MGCHFLLQCTKVKSESEVAQSCPTPNDPMDCSPPGSSVHGIFQARVLEWGAIAFSVRGEWIHINVRLTPFTVSPETTTMLLIDCTCEVLSHCSHIRLFVTPWTTAHQAPLSMESFRQEYWSGLPCPLPGDLPDPGIKLLSPGKPVNWQYPNTK